MGTRPGGAGAVPATVRPERPRAPYPRRGSSCSASVAQ